MVSLIVVSITFVDDVNTSEASIAVVGLGFYLAFFSIGMGPGAWLIPSEVFPSSVRTKAMSVATFFNRLTGTLMSSTFLSTASAMSWTGAFLLLAAVCTISALFIFFYLPETKGRSLEDMSMYFAEITGDQSLLEAEDKAVEKRRSTAAAEIEAVTLS
eukprot:CAMPEP_0198133994 /NCGR_PEP_ID=MMETSP1442-20131203/59852_1 /TAXON_ID= /ORGANISM="Craspedostauros australis, Strain CCMP3328" /LENGTH=157 /DNA_ID=CAMNT_0043795129 /DNA_START=197 /DNA_END=670 /DNA_ORIENTATION=-